MVRLFGFIQENVQIRWKMLGVVPALSSCYHGDGDGDGDGDGYVYCIFNVTKKALPIVFEK